METNLLKIISNFHKKKILLVGDLVLDQFLYGEISRISREAPVLILDYDKTVELLGGGANALHNIWALGAHVIPVGLVGADVSGEKLLSLLTEKEIDVSGVVKVNGYVTPTKTRILAGSSHSSKQQIVRIDKGNKFSVNTKLQNGILSKLEYFFNQPLDAVLISDYGYKLDCDEILRFLQKKTLSAKIPLIVDSRFDFHKYRDVTSITPNISEVEACYHTKIGNDISLLEAIGTRILREQNLRCLLITRGRYGMALFEPGKSPVHIPVSGSDEVADVTGAGDTVVATFTLALAAGANYYEASRVSNYAAGIVVMKRGTATVGPDELESVIKGI